MPRRGCPAADGARRCGRPARGFAFLFTLLLVALLGVSLVVVSEVDSTLKRREQEQALLQIGHEFREALARYSAPPPGVPASATGLLAPYPLKIDELLKDNRSARPRRHLRRLYADPITGKPDWGLVRQGGRIVGIYSQSSARPIRQDGFDADDAAFKGARRYRDWVFLHPADRPLLPAGGASAPLAAPVPATGASAQAAFGAVPPPEPR
jgi:hypothetical protein